MSSPIFTGLVVIFTGFFAARSFFLWKKFDKIVKTGIHTQGLVTRWEKKRSFRGPDYYIIHYSYNNNEKVGSFSQKAPCEPGTLIDVYLDPADAGKSIVPDRVTGQFKLGFIFLVICIAYLFFFRATIYLESRSIAANERTEHTLEVQMTARPLPYGSSKANFTGSKYIAFFPQDQSVPSAAAEISDESWVSFWGEPDTILWNTDSLQYEKQESYASSTDNPVLHIYFTENTEEDVFTLFMQYREAEPEQWETGSLKISCLTDHTYYTWESGGSSTTCRICSAADLGSCRLIIEYTEHIYDLTEEDAAERQTAVQEMVFSIWKTAQILDDDFERLTAPGPWAKRKIEDVNGLSVWSCGSGVWKKDSLENLDAAEGSVQTLMVTPLGKAKDQLSDLLKQKYISSDKTTAEELDDLDVDGRIVHMVRRSGKKLFKEKNYRKAVDYIAIMEMEEEAAVCTVSQYGTYEIGDIVPLIRTIFSEENLEIVLDRTEALELTGTVSVPDGMEDIGSGQAELQDPKYILAMDESSAVSAAAEIQAQDLFGGELQSVDWDASSLQESIGDITENGLDSLRVFYHFSDTRDHRQKTAYNENTEGTVKTDTGEVSYVWSVYQGKSTHANLYIDLPVKNENLWFNAEISLYFDDEYACDWFREGQLDSFVRMFSDKTKIFTSGYEQITAASPWADRLISYELDSENAAALVPGGSGSWRENLCSDILFKDGYTIEIKIDWEPFRDPLNSLVSSYHLSSSYYTVHESERHTIRTKNGDLEYILVSGTGGSILDGKKYCDCIANLELGDDFHLQITIKTRGVTNMDNAEELLQEIMDRVTIL